MILTVTTVILSIFVIVLFLLVGLLVEDIISMLLHRQLTRKESIFVIFFYPIAVVFMLIMKALS